MKAKKEHMWQAYIDGELSATEMAAFEETLSASERRLLSSDVQFDRALAERLTEDSCCPADIWARTKALLECQTQNEDTVELPPDNVVPMRPSWFRNIATIAAAAIITLMVSWALPSITGNSAPVILAETSVDELAANSEVEASAEHIQRYMIKHNYTLQLVAMDKLRIVQVHSDVQLLGAAHNRKGNVAELYIACCQQPVKIIIAERGTTEAKIIGQAIGQNNDLQSLRLVDNYVVGVVSKHPADGLLDIFAGQHH